MIGVKELTIEEMQSTKGGYCATFHSYYFCCPANTSAFQAKLKEYQAGRDQNKPSRYIKFCYERCNF